MKTNTRKMSPAAYARFAGVLYLIITVAAIFAHFVIPDQFIVSGDAAATAPISPLTKPHSASARWAVS